MMAKPPKVRSGLTIRRSAVMLLGIGGLALASGCIGHGHYSSNYGYNYNCGSNYGYGHHGHHGGDDLWLLPVLALWALLWAAS